MKKGVIISLVVITFFAFLFFGFKLLVTSIVNQRSCEFANIDNIEVNIGVDIPDIENSQCDYNEMLNIKSVYFKFKDQNVEEYILNYQFEKANIETEFESNYTDFLIGDLDKLIEDINHIYLKKEERKNNSHLAIYNSKTNEFWAIIRFND